MRQIIRFALGGAACGIVLGKNVSGAFNDIIPPERIRIVPNGIPDPCKGQAPTNKNGRGSRLLFLSTMTAEKGFLDLLRALPAVRERLGEIRAVFAGEWYTRGDREAAEKLVEEYQLGPNVEFVGPVGPARKYELLKGADILIFPSKNEGQPFVILEAMAAGLPIISTKVGCIPEMVEDGVNGFLIEPGDVDRLAEKICAVLSDGALRRRMGEASRERFLSEFTFDIFAKRMRGIFSEALNGVPAEHGAGAK